MTDTAPATLDTAARILARQLPMPRRTIDNTSADLAADLADDPAADLAIGEPNGGDQLN